MIFNNMKWVHSSIFFNLRKKIFLHSMLGEGSGGEKP